MTTRASSDAAGGVVPPWLQRWSRAAFALDVRSLAAYRVALGAILCIDCLLRARDFDLVYAVNGVFPPDVMRNCRGDPAAWSLAFLHDSNWWNAAVVALEGVSGLLLAAGAATRLATVMAWAAVWSLVRRAGPAADGGDVWLACQLFWATFIPLGAAWSWDARRRGVAGTPGARCSVCSIATAALVLQVVVVYVSAGVAKCNPSWLRGDALAHALSVHVHGTAVGMALARSGLVGDPLAWCVVAFEIGAPLLALARPTPRARGLLIAAFVAFHAAVGLTMRVGLFVPLGIAAWLPLVPAAAWDRGRPVGDRPVRAGLGRVAGCCCAGALLLAVVSLCHDRCGQGRLPRAVVTALDLTGLHQDWRMFGTVAAEEQWVYARAELADGRVVDLLRGGRPCDGARPEGGFTSLGDQRWHNVCWCLGGAAPRPVAPAVAAGLARHWNAAHGPDARVTRVDILHGRRGVAGADPVEREAIVASWPPRDASGRGGLDRLLDERGDRE